MESVTGERVQRNYSKTAEQNKEMKTKLVNLTLAFVGLAGARGADRSGAVEHISSADRSELGSTTANGILATA
jgi:hypothetical protein